MKLESIDQVHVRNKVYQIRDKTVVCNSRQVNQESVRPVHVSVRVSARVVYVIFSHHRNREESEFNCKKEKKKETVEKFCLESIEKDGSNEIPAAD